MRDTTSKHNQKEAAPALTITLPAVDTNVKPSAQSGKASGKSRGKVDY